MTSHDSKITEINLKHMTKYKINEIQPELANLK